MKVIILYLLRSIGIFKLSKFLVRKKLLILTYHGFEINDESSFNSQMFMKRSTLEQRMAYLKREGFHVLSLDEALKKLNARESLPENSVVITLDDGWYSSISHADPVFSEYSYPYTIYVSSYYVKKGVPVLNVVLNYLLWACSKKEIILDLLAIPELTGTYSISDKKERNELHQKLFGYFNSLGTNSQLEEFIKNVSSLLEVDYDKIEAGRGLGFLSFSELRELSDKGVDIQLHTHRHNIPFDDRERFEKEIYENRQCINPYVKKKMEHFCYPSGQYESNCDSVLKHVGVFSATTCARGFITKESDFYYLPRFLDSECTPQITFEAEVCGVLEFLRKVKRLPQAVVSNS